MTGEYLSEKDREELRKKQNNFMKGKRMDRVKIGPNEYIVGDVIKLKFGDVEGLVEIESIDDNEVLHLKGLDNLRGIRLDYENVRIWEKQVE